MIYLRLKNVFWICLLNIVIVIWNCSTVFYKRIKASIKQLKSFLKVRIKNISVWKVFWKARQLFGKSGKCLLLNAKQAGIKQGLLGDLKILHSIRDKIQDFFKKFRNFLKKSCLKNISDRLKIFSFSIKRSQQFNWRNEFLS